MKNNISTFNYMIENRKVIIETVNENVSIPKAWDQLKEKLSEAEKVVKFNIFKGCVKTLKIVNDIMNEKDKLLKTNEMLRSRFKSGQAKFARPKNQVLYQSKLMGGEFN